MKTKTMQHVTLRVNGKGQWILMLSGGEFKVELLAVDVLNALEGKIKPENFSIYGDRNGIVTIAQSKEGTTTVEDEFGVENQVICVQLAEYSFKYDDICDGIKQLGPYL